MVLIISLKNILYDSMSKYTNMTTEITTKSNKMTQAKKGLKGFAKLPSHLVKSSVYNYRMTKAELDTLNDYCKENNLTKADAIRTALSNLYLKTK